MNKNTFKIDDKFLTKDEYRRVKKEDVFIPNVKLPRKVIVKSIKKLKKIE